ncbi:MAG TPA: serine hydrolase domain-containing protein [Acidimicrobiales bacterium]|jgi:CubicO group peptidase (beta-lactamase class C family)|nr:serine hydrolase domain-containing protein [Acidimicrobiales bacterium]
MAQIHGTCDERFIAVRDTLAANLDSGQDVGASVAVVLDGRPVVDIFGGVIDDDGTPWAADTIINVYSTTKTMVGLTALILADRGELDLHAPVSRYWPEFKAAGKEAIEVCHVLGHTAGLAGWTEPMTAEDLYDWDLCCARLAAQEPWWEPGTASGYHALTEGYLVGEIVRRITGDTLGTFFAREVARPLGADFHIGTGAEHDVRIARVIPPPPLEMPDDPDAFAVRTLANPRLAAEESWTEQWRRAEIPAANGHGNARSVARVQSALACRGEVDGIRLLSAAGCEAVFEEQAHGVDLVLGIPVRLGVGYGLNLPELPVSPNPRTCFWGGWGGSLVVVDLDARLVVSYVMNRMGEGTTGDMRGAAIVMSTYGALAAAGSG